MIHDAQDGQGGDALAAAAFPDDAQHLSGSEVEADTVHRPDDPLPSEEMSLQVPDREDPVLSHELRFSGRRGPRRREGRLPRN